MKNILKTRYNSSKLGQERGDYMTEHKLKGKRVAKGIKQGYFAKQLGITPQYLCQIEKGTVEPRRDLMIKIAEALGEDVKELFFQ